MSMRRHPLGVLTGFAIIFALLLSNRTLAQASLDVQLKSALAMAGFTGKIESTLETRLGRRVDPALADLGRQLWFDTISGLHGDNTCAGCHSPGNGFGDSQSIAIGVQNNRMVGPHRAGPRNQRRTPSALNTAFYPALMWNGRFFAPSGDPFKNSQGFTFPLPEGTTAFPPNHPTIKHLLIAQGHIPPTELVEAAGFTGTAGTIAPDFDQFDDGVGLIVPPADGSGFRNAPIRSAVVARLNNNATYRRSFSALFQTVAAGGSIDFVMVARALAEFEFTLTYANAPIDRFARGDTAAMTTAQKRGALVFFGKGKCTQCHQVSGKSNEMFSDFKNHVAGIPQVAAFFGVGQGNVIFDGPGNDEDFGLEQVTGNPADRYKFRTSPLRNVSTQAAFFHNGAFTRLDDAIRHHLNAASSARVYSPTAAGLDPDLTYRLGPIDPVLNALDPLLAQPVVLSSGEFSDLVTFVREGLLDARAVPGNACGLAPKKVLSGATPLRFEACK